MESQWIMCESVRFNACVSVDIICKMCVHLVTKEVTKRYTNTTFTGELAATRVFSKLRACTERIHHSVHKSLQLDAFLSRFRSIHTHSCVA